MNFKILFLLAILINSFALAQPAPKTLRYISLDAGALLELVPISLLERIEQDTGKPISQLVDGFMGVSSGAIVAALASTPNKPSREPRYSMTAIKEAFEAKAMQAFTPRALSNALFHWLEWHDLADYEGAGANLEALLLAQYGDTYLSQVTTHLMVATYDSTQRRPLLFNSQKARLDPDQDLPLWQAVRASTALPFMFGNGAAQFNTTKTWTDLKDPGLVGYVDPTSLLCNELKGAHPGDQEIVVYSLGTGFSHSKNKNYIYRCAPNIEVVRMEPDYSDREQSWVRTALNYQAGSESVGYNMDINYLAAVPLSWYMNYIKEHAEPLYRTPQYRRMLRDLFNN